MTSTKKLTLAKDTLRLLQTNEPEFVWGGMPPVATIIGTACPTSPTINGPNCDTNTNKTDPY
jgi:hypothetical protein